MALAEVNSWLCRRFCRVLTKLQITSASCNILGKKRQNRNYCTSNTELQDNDKDPLEYFLNDKIQELLIALTGLKAEQYFSLKKGNILREPQFKLLTDAELAVEQKKFEKKARLELQMPPIMKPRENITKVLSEDPDIADGLESKFAFIDISPDVPNRDRNVVVRDVDGTLRAASWDERDRLTQIYSPFPGRKLFPPKMFEEEQLEEILPQKNYLYILERASVQFEPDHPSYVRVSQRVFEHVCSTNSFDDLRSTRYFGPMAFYFCWVKKIEPLLIDMLNRNLLSHGLMLVQLYDSLHNVTHRSYEDALTVVKDFCEADASSTYKGQLELAITGYEATYAKQEMQQSS